MLDQFDVTLIDSDLQAELELITDLMIAANASAGHLPADTPSTAS